MNLTALVAVLAIAGEEPADTAPIEPKTFSALCKDGFCIAPLEELRKFSEANAALIAEVNRLRAELAATREMKGCGKLEVLPKLKKERNL